MIRFSFLNIIFKYVRGPCKKAKDICINMEPKLKNKLNLAGDSKIRGKNVRAISKNRQPMPKNTAKA